MYFNFTRSFSLWIKETDRYPNRYRFFYNYFKSETLEGGKMEKKVAVIMGSDSDLPIVTKAIDKLRAFEITTEVHVMSAHRTPMEACEFASKARENGFSVIIAAAGMAAHLAGVLAANTTLPVIGIPCKSTSFDGMDALLSTVQMPKGIPVATVAVNGAENAAILAAQMIAISDKDMEKRLSDMKKEMKDEVLQKDAKLQEALKK